MNRETIPLLDTRIKALSVFALGSLAAYLLVLRPRQLRWGATDEEVARPLPGDEIVERPTFNGTRAVTVEARPEDIWPWLVQMGFHRAGWYSYDWDNLFRPSAERIIPELQHIAVGDFYPQGPGEKSGLWVKDFEPNRWMLWWDQKEDASWLWFLDPVSEASTRLITRVRIRYRWMSPGILFLLALDVGDIVMMRKCMLGIKRRAEATGALRGRHGQDLRRVQTRDRSELWSEECQAVARGQVPAHSPIRVVTREKGGQ